MTYQEMKQFIQTEVPFTALEKNKGIYEFHQDGFLSIGVSYEIDEESNDVYIYNLFYDDEYINISGSATIDEQISDTIILELVNTWNRLLNKNKKN